MDELLNNLFLPETRTKILSIAQRMKNEDGIEALVLAGTELPLLLRGSSTPGIEFLDTTVIHVEAVVDEFAELNGRVVLRVPAHARLDQNGDTEAIDNEKHSIGLLTPTLFLSRRSVRVSSPDRMLFINGHLDITSVRREHQPNTP